MQPCRLAKPTGMVFSGHFYNHANAVRLAVNHRCSSLSWVLNPWLWCCWHFDVSVNLQEKEQDVIYLLKTYQWLFPSQNVCVCVCMCVCLCMWVCKQYQTAPVLGGILFHVLYTSFLFCLPTILHFPLIPWRPINTTRISRNSMTSWQTNTTA